MSNNAKNQTKEPTTETTTAAMIETAQTATNLNIDAQGKSIKAAYKAVSEKLTDNEKLIAIVYGNVVPKMDDENRFIIGGKVCFAKNSFGKVVSAESVADSYLSRFGLKRISENRIVPDEYGKHVFGDITDIGEWESGDFVKDDNDESEPEHGIKLTVQVKVSETESAVYGLNLNGKSCKKMAKYVATAVKETGKKPSKKSKKEE